MFQKAKPIWLTGAECERNILVGFRALLTEFTSAPVLLRLAGATLYRVFLNGQFLHHGPARGPHGFYRVDELDLTPHLSPAGPNLLAIEVTGYASNSYAYLNQPAFLQAEIEQEGHIRAATGQDGFSATRLTDRIQKVDRYCFQRPYLEVYRKNSESDQWRHDPEVTFPTLPCTVQPAKRLLPRRVALPAYETKPSLGILRRGGITLSTAPVDRARFGAMPPETYQVLDSFLPTEFELDVLQLYQNCTGTDAASAPDSGRYELHDLGQNLTGFIQLKVECYRPARLLAVYDEVLLEGDVKLERTRTLGLLYYDLQPGTYALEALEPNTLRYLKLIMPEGGMDVTAVALREYANPEASRARFASSDPDLNRIFEAGRQTFRQNAVDFYSDCPGRERAGWLCDSFFTGQAEPVLCGGSTVERNFLENFALPEKFEHLPEGMLPMCYPAEHPNHVHIPQWALWLILQLEDYQERTGDTGMAEALRGKVFALLAYLQKFENTDGLLEKLPGWNFVEWSMANKFMNDVNYPTNMLYAGALEAAARLYGKARWAAQAKALKDTIRAQALPGLFFADNAIRDEQGTLRLSGECTEVCQYYAFFFDVASPETHPELWTTLLEHFGSTRQPGSPHPSVHPANAFIGYFLRLDLLSRYGQQARLLEEIKGYFLRMATTTGTLWEHHDTRASCNHGFASHLCTLLFRDALGVRSVDRIHRRIILQNPAVSLDSCQGTLRLPDGEARLAWSRPNGSLVWTVDLPPGWTTEQTNSSF